MWDFDIGRTLGIMFRTWPFIALRLIVYFGITVAYVLATGTGAGIGYGVGNIFAEGGPEGMAFWGGIIGFSLVSLALYWLREYILYVVKAGHIAVMVHLLDGKDVPGGQGQIAYARQVVTQRFAEANILFVMDQLVKGAIGAITGLIGGIAAFLPIPGLQGLVSFINTVIRMSLTYVDEIILGYNIRLNSQNPFETPGKAWCSMPRTARSWSRTPSGCRSSCGCWRSWCSWSCSRRPRPSSTGCPANSPAGRSCWRSFSPGPSSRR